MKTFFYINDTIAPKVQEYYVDDLTLDQYLSLSEEHQAKLWNKWME